MEVGSAVVKAVSWRQKERRRRMLTRFVEADARHVDRSKPSVPRGLHNCQDFEMEIALFHCLSSCSSFDVALLAYREIALLCGQHKHMGILIIIQ
jgi:hypothetical protein